MFVHSLCRPNSSLQAQESVFQITDSIGKVRLFEDEDFAAKLCQLSGYFALLKKVDSLRSGPIYAAISLNIHTKEKLMGFCVLSFQLLLHV